MKMPITLMLFAALISFNLSACSSISGNVVPKSGPKMETVYDSMGDQNNTNNLLNKINMGQTHRSAPTWSLPEPSVGADLRVRPVRGFHKIPNPELRMYIYPHLAGRDQIPVPGYMTVFNVYEQDNYDQNCCDAA